MHARVLVAVGARDHACAVGAVSRDGRANEESAVMAAPMVPMFTCGFVRLKVVHQR